MPYDVRLLAGHRPYRGVAVELTIQEWPNWPVITNENEYLWITG